MFIAIDQNENRIPIEDEAPNTKYYCPICKSEVYARAGDKVARHFAHYKSYNDKWKYDMSTWRQNNANISTH
jgi:competence CoiA-like predicted nuclease